MIENEIVLPGGVSWLVRAFEFPDVGSARDVWEEIEEASRGQGDNFSVWRTTNPERTIHLVVVCGRREHLPAVEGGTPFEFSAEEARMFALRRARVGLDAEQRGEQEHVEQEARYGEAGMVIDPTTGKVKPYRQRE